MDFDTAFARLLGHEGGYVDHPDDPGGATRWGVTERVARANGYAGPMQEFPESEARRIYKASYWDAVQADQLPAPLRFHVFDAAVNSGVRQAALWLQRAVGVLEDGVIGARTVAAACAADPARAAGVFSGLRLQAMTDMRGWPSFGRGWARRIAANLTEAGCSPG